MSAEQHVLDQLPAYALGSLDEAEVSLVVEHLAVCETCQEELHMYQEVVDALPLAVPVVEPPPGLKRSILDSITQKPAPEPALSGWQRLAGLLRRPSPALSVISLALVVVLAVSNLLLWQQVQQMQTPAPGNMQVVVLQGTENVPQATGSMVIGRDGLVGTLVVDGLPPLDENHEYQLWFIENGERISGGVFSVSEKGYGSLYIRAPKPVKTFTGLGVTVEPAGGSPGPTGERVLGIDL